MSLFHENFSKFSSLGCQCSRLLPYGIFRLLPIEGDLAVGKLHGSFQKQANSPLPACVTIFNVWPCQSVTD